MKSLTATAVVAVAAVTIGLATIVPAVHAQQAPQPPDVEVQQLHPHHMPWRGFGRRHGRAPMQMHVERMQGGRGGLLGLACSERGAERMQIAFVRLSHRIDLTAEQQPLFDDLRTAALTAQTSFADACAEARPAATADANQAMPDPVTGLRTMLEVEQLRLDALEALLPKFEAFYNSLTDEQKAELGRGRGRGGRFPQHLPAPGTPAPIPGSTT